jgi:hypothetical protein
LEGIAGTTIVRLQHAPSSAELKGLLMNVRVLGIRSRTQLTSEVLAMAPELRAVGSYCTGTNNIDLEAASEMGIALFNGPFSNTRSVAELVLGHAIHLLRRVPERNAAAHRGNWMKDAKGANEVRGKTLGIVGYGKVGTQTGLLAEEVSEKLRDYLTLGAIRGSVNLPELPVSPHRPPGRFVHLHRDRPGVMAKVNAVLSSAGLNVSQLHLETQGGFGVAVIDVSANLNEATLGSLREIEGTTRVFSVACT